MPLELLVQNTARVVTCAGPDAGDAQAQLGALARGVLGVEGGRVAFIGHEAELPPNAIGPRTRLIDAGGGFVGPGYVDPHTHLVFAGERLEEYALRNLGAGYTELAKGGGGIMRTVEPTRAASLEAVVAAALPRARRLLEAGVTTAEVKSGYGLDVASELKLLEAIRALNQLQPIELVPTLLAAHAVPPEHRAHREAYVALITDELIPQVTESGLARACDVFVEGGAFTADEARRVAAAARARGMVLHLHVDQLSDGGGALLAAELSAQAAAHLEFVSPRGIEALAASGTVAVLAPVSTLFLHVARAAPGRGLWDAGVEVALATNLNPGSAMSESVSLTLGLACLLNGLRAEEAYLAFTRHAAAALGRGDVGRLVVGGPADVVVHSCSAPEHLAYHLGVNHAAWVIKGGRVVVERPRDVCQST